MEMHREESSKNYVSLALLIWFASLFIPAFVFGQSVWLGWEVWLSGLFIGWMTLSFQAFTNFAFLIAVFRFLYGNNPYTLSIFTFFIGATSFALPIRYWGWGAILWISAFAIVMILAIARENLKRFEQVKLWLIAIPITIFVIFVIGQFQYHILDMNTYKLTSWQMAIINPRVTR